MKKNKLINYLDEYLKIKEFNDNSKNWLQIDNSKEEIKKIWYSVDATSYIFEKAKQEWIDMVLSHHGIFWWHEEVLVWVPYKRAKLMLENDISSYAAHLPLDAHNEVGNNIWLLKAFINIFWLKESDCKIEPFWEYNWMTIWYWLKFEQKIHISNMISIYAEKMQLQKNLYNFWNKDYIKSIAFISGWAWSEYTQAYNLWYDLYITWEANHSNITWAKELWQSIMLWGHYETEKIWPKLLSYHLRDKFWIEIVFLDEKY